MIEGPRFNTRPTTQTHWEAKPGQRLDWLPEHYKGPPGVIAVMAFNEVPEGIYIFIKDYVIISTWCPDEDPMGLNKPEIVETGVDAMICHPNSHPGHRLGPQRMAEMEAETKAKHFN